MRKKTYSIDYDDTFTSDPDAFTDIANVLRNRGHEVIITSQRCEKYEADMRKVVGQTLPIVFASGMSKEAAARLHGYAVDVWMDDVPWSVDNARTYGGCVGESWPTRHV